MCGNTMNKHNNIEQLKREDLTKRQHVLSSFHHCVSAFALQFLKNHIPMDSSGIPSKKTRTTMGTMMSIMKTGVCVCVRSPVCVCSAPMMVHSVSCISGFLLSFFPLLN